MGQLSMSALARSARRLARLVVLAIATLGPAVHPVETHADDARLAPSQTFTDKAHAFFQRETAKPGPRPTAMSIGLSRDGTMVFGMGLGSGRPNEAATVATPYRIGSITKQFTALALLDLIETGATGPSGMPVTLSTPISEVLPDLKRWDDDERPRVAIRHLLSMTANVPNFTRRPPGDLSPWNAVAERELLAAIGRYVPAGPPVEFEYSNTCYFLIAEIIEALVEAKSSTFKDYVKARVIDRAKLENTQFWGLSGTAALPNYTRRPAFVDGVWLKGSADLVSSVSDLLTWNAVLMSGSVFSRAARENLFSEAARVDVETWYGMGWFRREKDGRTYFSHSGSVPGYTSFSLIVKEESGRWSSCVVLTNGDNVENVDEFAEDMALLALE